MSFQTQKAINRVFNTFKRLKNSIFQEDVDALKTINEFFEESKKQTVQDNKLFAKLLCLQLCQNVNHYGNLDTALKVLKDEIEQPLEYNLQFLVTYINTAETLDFAKSIGINKVWMNQEEYDKQLETIKEHQKEFIEKLKTVWDFETVEKNFYNTANELLKDVNNYK